MQKEHREAIQKNFSSLVEQTDLDRMVSALYEKGVFSDLMIEPYRDVNKDMRARKRQLYRDITRRGPDAFRNLLDALSEDGYWDLVRDLDPNSSLHMRNARPTPSCSGESRFYSLPEKKKSGKEQNDPNQNRAGVSSHSPTEKKTSTSTPIETNGNAERVSPPKATPMDEIPQFNVIKSKKFIEDNESDIKLYRTRGRNRGVALVFSYVKFRGDLEQYRHGARKDSDNLRYLFSELGFRVITYSNLSYSETLFALSGLRAGLCGERPESVFVVFSSHGYARQGSGDTDLRCSDGQLLSLYHIVDYFNNDNFPELSAVPKVFIFQTCRGNNKDYATLTPTHLTPPAVPRHAPYAPALAPALAPAPAGGEPQGAEVGVGVAYDGATRFREGQTGTAAGDARDAAATDDARDRLYSDILIAHSTVPGYVSSRDSEGGSWYIQALCDVFAARAHDCHVEKLFTLVDERLKQRFVTQTSSVDRWGFNRRLYLHPGLYED